MLFLGNGIGRLFVCWVFFALGQPAFDVKKELKTCKTVAVKDAFITKTDYIRSKLELSWPNLLELFYILLHVLVAQCSPSAASPSGDL